MTVFTIVVEGFGKEFDSDAAAELGVGGLIHVTPSAGSDVARDLVMCEFRADHGAKSNLAAHSIKQPMSLSYLKLVVEARKRNLSGRKTGTSESGSGWKSSAGQFPV